MCALRKKVSPRKEVLSFPPYPKLHCTKKWYVDFLHSPRRQGKCEEKISSRLNKKLKERRQRGAELIEALLKQLRSGWNPWVSSTENRGYPSIEFALAKYEKSLEKLEKLKTKQSYQSKLNVLREYMSLQQLPPKYVYQITTSFVGEFLDWLYLDREVSGRTRNNYRGAPHRPIGYL